MLIAGPCVLEEEGLVRRIAERLAAITADLPLQLIFKSSFDKANRTSLSSFRGPGLERGLEILARVAADTGLPVTTDLHEAWQAAPVGDVLRSAANSRLSGPPDRSVGGRGAYGKAVHVKKGQFMAPADMRYVVDKLRQSGGHDMLLLGERGTFFGYGRLVNDMRSLVEMRELGVPVVFDATHSVQQPGGLGGATGGQRAMIEPLAAPRSRSASTPSSWKRTPIPIMLPVTDRTWYRWTRSSDCCGRCWPSARRSRRNRERDE